MKILIVDNRRKKVPVDGRPFFGVGYTGTFLCVARPNPDNTLWPITLCSGCPFRMTMLDDTDVRCGAYFKCPDGMHIVEAEETLE